jgi:hypothetical protein
MESVTLKNKQQKVVQVDMTSVAPSNATSNRDMTKLSYNTDIGAIIDDRDKQRPKHNK